MKLIAGLGNPGEKYAFTRHNMGWLCVNHLISKNNLGEPLNKFNGEFWKWHDVIFLKPLTYMNLSGISVSEVVNFYKIELENILIIYDDMALPFGKFRMRAQGSAGGHNGLASIIGAIGDLKIPRLRIGIGKSQGSKIDYVIGNFNEEELEAIPGILDRAERAIDAWLNMDIQKAMSFVNVN